MKIALTNDINIKSIELEPQDVAHLGPDDRLRAMRGEANLVPLIDGRLEVWSGQPDARVLVATLRFMNDDGDIPAKATDR